MPAPGNVHGLPHAIGMGAAIGCELANVSSFAVPDSFTLGTTVTLDQENWKNGVAHSTTVNPSQITILVPGKYIIIGSFALPTNANTGGVGMTVLIDGASSAVAAINNQGTSGNNYFARYSFSSVKPLRVGDVVTFNIGQKSGGSMTFGALACICSLTWIGL